MKFSPDCFGLALWSDLPQNIKTEKQRKIQMTTTQHDKESREGKKKSRMEKVKKDSKRERMKERKKESKTEREKGRKEGR